MWPQCSVASPRGRSDWRSPPRASQRRTTSAASAGSTLEKTYLLLPSHCGCSVCSSAGVVNQRSGWEARRSCTAGEGSSDADSAMTTPRRGVRPRASSTVTARCRRLWPWAWRASTSAATREGFTAHPAPGIGEGGGGPGAACQRGSMVARCACVPALPPRCLCCLLTRDSQRAVHAKQADPCTHDAPRRHAAGAAAAVRRAILGRLRPLARERGWHGLQRRQDLAPLGQHSLQRMQLDGEQGARGDLPHNPQLHLAAARGRGKHAEGQPAP